MSNSAYRKLSANTIDGVYSPRNYFPNPTGSVNTAGAALYSDTQTATMTIASPAVVTVTSTTGFYSGMPLIFTTTGALPTGVTSGTTYYITTVDSGTTFKFSATLGGSNVNTSGSQSGTHTFRPLVPVTGTGGTATGLTLSSSTSSPIRFDANYLLAQTNSTIVAGRGLSFDFSIDDADKAKVQQIIFDYNASSTFVASSGQTGSNSDLMVFIYDVTNLVWLPVSPAVITANGTNNFTFAGTFQTASNSNSYRLCIHSATNSANATGWSFKLSGGYIGQQRTIQGAPITDWVSYTPTLGAGFGSATNISFSYKREGDTLFVKGTFTTGTTAASLGTFTLPSGLSIDTGKISISNTTSNAGPQCGNFACPNTNYYGPLVTATGTSSTLVYVGDQIANSAKLTPQNINVVIGSSVITSVNFQVPILGWASNVQMSNDTDTRVVAAVYKGAFANVTANNPIKFPTVVQDTHAAFSVSTGQFTVPVSGSYTISAFIDSNAASGSFLQVYKNGTLQYTMGVITSTNQGGGTAIVSANAGDLIDVRCTGSITASGATSQVSISRISGPSTIAVTDTVACRYTNTAGTSMSNSGFNNVPFATKDYDTTGSFSGTVFTCPVSGKYRVEGSIQTDSNTWAVNNQVVLAIYKNGASVSQGQMITAQAATSYALGTSISDTVSCVAGDTLELRLSMNRTAGSTSLTATAGANHIAIVRVGN